MPFDKINIIRKMLELGLIDKETLSRVLLLAKSRNLDILQILANYSNMSLEQIQEFAIEHFDMFRIDLDDIVLNPEVVKLIPLELALAHRMIPAFRILNRTHLAVSNPFDLEGINRVKGYIGEDSGLVLVSEDQVVSTIRKIQPAV
jgi:hypothetical protein